MLHCFACLLLALGAPKQAIVEYHVRGMDTPWGIANLRSSVAERAQTRQWQLLLGSQLQVWSCLLFRPMYLELRCWSVFWMATGCGLGLAQTTRLSSGFSHAAKPYATNSGGLAYEYGNRDQTNSTACLCPLTFGAQWDCFSFTFLSLSRSLARLLAHSLTHPLSLSLSHYSHSAIIKHILCQTYTAGNVAALTAVQRELEAHKQTLRQRIDAMQRELQVCTNSNKNQLSCTHCAPSAFRSILPSHTQK